MLKLNNIQVIYSNVILVLKGLSLEVPGGQIVALLGANGAGKTTTLKAISGLLKTEDGKVTHGSIELAGRRIDGLDVLVDEPPAGAHPLFALPNVTLTPHSAGPTWENWTARFRNGFDNIERVAAGRRPRWVIPELA